MKVKIVMDFGDMFDDNIEETVYYFNDMDALEEFYEKLCALAEEL